MDFIDLINEWTRKNEVRRIYPRMIGLNRTIANDEIDVVGYVVERRRIDCYMSIFSEFQIRNDIFDTLYLDIDCHDEVDLDKIVECVCEKTKKVVEVMGEPSRAYWSGRGMALFYDFTPTRMHNYKNNAIIFLRSNGLIECVDKTVVGDVKRMARIVDTINGKCGLKEVKLDIDSITNSYKIKEAIKAEQHSECVGEKCDWLIGYLNVDNGVKTIAKRSVEKNIEGLNMLPTCIKEGVRLLIETGELEHMWRVVISLYLLKAWGYERTFKLFEEFANDFNARKTEYQLNFLREKGYYCYSCSKLKQLGICVFDEQSSCAFYILSDGWLEKVVTDGIKSE